MVSGVTIDHHLRSVMCLNAMTPQRCRDSWRVPQQHRTVRSMDANQPQAADPQETVSRRRVARGIAWSVPAIAMATAAPAMAASPPPRVSVGGTASWNTSSYHPTSNTCGTGQFALVLDGRGFLGTSYREWDGLWFPDTRATDQICNVTLTFWFSRAGLTWTALTGVTNWSTPTATGATTTYNGTTYYEYRAVYRSGACFAASTLTTGYNGWYGIAYGWKTTQCFSSRPGSNFRVGATATVRNLALTNTSAWGAIS